MSAVHRQLAEARLYLCTDARRERGDLAEFVEAALDGGVDIIQLRDKGPGAPLEARDELAALEIIGDACRRHGALFAVNDRADIALAAGAEILIGRSSHDFRQADAAADEPGVDYFCAGPVWPTPTKPGRPAPGLPLV